MITEAWQKVLREELTGRWYELLKDVVEEGWLPELLKAIRERRKAGKKIYPKDSDIFNAYKWSNPNKVKVIIVGQDPYHTADVAHGLAFSSAKEGYCPPSLENIFTEIFNDVFEGGKVDNFPRDGKKKGDINAYFDTPNLYHWSDTYGIMLLNSILTVEEGKAGSHAKIGWQKLTGKTIEVLYNMPNPKVWMLWGDYARTTFMDSIGNCISNDTNLILRAAHPSPLSAEKGFLGCKHFSKANVWLESKGVVAPSWQTYEPDSAPF